MADGEANSPCSKAYLRILQVFFGVCEPSKFWISNSQIKPFSSTQSKPI